MVLEINSLSKRYSKKANFTISDINMHVNAYEVVGIIGHNGAGKSTTIKCLTGMHPYELGTIKINNFDLTKDPILAKQHIGYVSDEFSLFEAMTGFELLNFMADIYKVDKETRNKRIKELDDKLKLGDNIYKNISSYSHGMKQKISIMAALIHEPKLFILDEPMVGLDPYTIKELMEFFIDYAKKGNAVVFSSHNLDIVRRICDRVYIIDQGKLKDEINIKELEEGFDFDNYFFNITNRVAKV